MGFFRGGLLFVAGVFLLASFLAGNVFLTLTLSLTPENLQEEFVSNLDKITELTGNEINLTKEIEEKFETIESHCENNSEFVFSEQGYTIDVSCEVVEEGHEAVVEEGVSDVIDKIYYENYSCGSPWKCLISFENPLFLLSEQAKNYWKSMFYYSLIVSLFLVAIMFFLVERKSNLFFGIGFLLIISSLPFMKINAFLSFFDYSFLQFITILFSEAYKVFLITSILGVVILLVGIGLKFFNFGSIILDKLDETAFKWKDSSKKKISKNKKSIERKKK